MAVMNKQEQLAEALRICYSALSTYGSHPVIRETVLPLLNESTGSPAFFMPDTISDDIIDKVESLIGYLKIWANNGKKPLELESVIKDAEEWTSLCLKIK